MQGLAIRNLATYPPAVQTYAVKAFGPFFTWMYHLEDAAVRSVLHFENMDTPVTMNQLRFLQSRYERALLQQVAADMSRPKTNIKETEDQASTYQKQQWINWRTASFISLEVCSPDRQVGKHANTKHNRSIQTFHTCAEASPAERVPLHDWDVNWFSNPLGAWQ